MQQFSSPGAPAEFNLDLTGVSAESKGGGPLPAGEYLIQFDKFENCENQSKTGWYIGAEYTVIGGEFDGRKLFENFNWQHTNPKAVEVGMARLKQFIIAASNGQAGGTVNFEVLNGLMGSEVLVEVGVRKDDKGKERNRIWEFFTKDGGQVMDTGIVPRTAPPGPAPAATTPAPQPAPTAAPAPQPTAADPAPAPQAPAAPVWQQGS